MTNGMRAGEVVQQPDPELLRRFEAERNAAAEDQRRAAEQIRRGEAMIRDAEQERRAAQRETDRKLCEMGALPPDACP